MAGGFYDVAQSTYSWIQSAYIVKSIGPDLRSTPWRRPDPGGAARLSPALRAGGVTLPGVGNADRERPDARSAPALVPTIEDTKEM